MLISGVNNPRDEEDGQQRSTAASPGPLAVTTACYYYYSYYSINLWIFMKDVLWKQKQTHCKQSSTTRW